MYPTIKRFFDFFCSLLGLIILSPILVIATIVLKFTNEGKILFIQTRVGHKNNLFNIWKFTTMLSTPPNMKGKTITGKRDPRITPIGAFLRNSKIDEFPQLFNVLKGDMSFVGPRPLMKDPDFNSYPPEVQKVIYNVRPGITAIGSVVFRDEAALITQVEELGKDPAEFKQKVIFPYKGQLEVWYNENQSFWVDVKILLLTAWTLIFPTSQLAFKAFKDLPERGKLLQLELTRMQQLKESVTLLGIMVAVLIPLVPSPYYFWDNLQFILMAFIPVLGFAYLLYRHKEVPIQLIPSDIGWGIFLVTGFLSFFWAINGSLIWYQGFGWFSLVLWMLLFRAISVRTTAINIMPILFCFFFLVMIFHHLVSLFFNVSIDESWNHFFGKNANYTSSFLVCLYPYLLFFKSKYRIIELLKLFFTAGILLVTYLTNADWATLALLFIGWYYLWHTQSKRSFYSITGVMTLFGFFLLTLYSFNPNAVVSLPGIYSLTALTSSFKYYLFCASNMILLEHPLVGIGLGNWHLEAYNFDWSKIERFNDPTNFTRLRSHNLYTRHLAELGLIGGIAFLYPIIKAIGYGWRDAIRDNNFHQAAYASLMVYLITSFFYNDVNFYEFNFSAIQLLAFCALGILTSDIDGIPYTLPKWIKSIFILASFCSLGWFVYAKFANDQYWGIKKEMEQGDIEIAIRKLEEMYHPTFKTTHGFIDKYSHNRLLTLDLAKLYQEKGIIEKAETYFQLALEEAPYNERVIIAYATFLLQDKKETSRAKEYALQIYKKQPNHYELNLLLAEIALKETDYRSTKQYLQLLENTEFQKKNPLVNQLKKELESFQKSKPGE